MRSFPTTGVSTVTTTHDTQWPANRPSNPRHHATIPPYQLCVSSFHHAAGWEGNFLKIGGMSQTMPVSKHYYHVLVVLHLHISPAYPPIIHAQRAHPPPAIPSAIVRMQYGCLMQYGLLSRAVWLLSHAVWLLSHAVWFAVSCSMVYCLITLALFLCAVKLY